MWHFLVPLISCANSWKSSVQVIWLSHVHPRHTAHASLYWSEFISVCWGGNNMQQFNVDEMWCRILTGHSRKRWWLQTDVFHGEAVVLVEVGDVLAAQLHAVGDPGGCVIHVEEALPVWMDILWTLFPFTVVNAEGRKHIKEERERDACNGAHTHTHTQ